MKMPRLGRFVCFLKLAPINLTIRSFQDADEDIECLEESSIHGPVDIP